MNKRWSLLLYLATVVLFSSWAILPISDTTTAPDSANVSSYYDTLTIQTPFLQNLLFWLSLFVATILFFLGVRAYERFSIRFPVFAVLLAIIAFPVAGLVHIFSDISPWTMHGQVTDSSGRQYIFCDSSFLQGQTMALARIESESLWYIHFKVLGTTNGDSPRSWASVIRPANAENKYGQLYLTENNILLGIRYGNQCYFAYDLNKEKFIGHGDIEKISPFLCLNAKDELHAPDIASVYAAIVKPSPGTPGYPNRKAVEAELNNANPHVPKLAEKILKLTKAANMSETKVVP